MAKMGIYLAVREQIMLYALETMLETLNLPIRPEVLGKTSDVAVCVRQIEELQPEFVVLDHKLSAENGRTLSDVFLECYPKMTQILLLSSKEEKKRQQVLVEENQVVLIKSEVSEETLADVLEQAWQERSGRAARNRLRENRVLWIGVWMGRSSIDCKKARYLYGMMRKQFLEKGYLCHKERTKRGFLMFAVETLASKRREFWQDTRSIVQGIDRTNFENPVFVSQLRGKGEWTGESIKRFEESLYHAGFYEIEADVFLEEESVDIQKFWQEEFPHSYYKKLLEKADFVQAAKVLLQYLKKGREERLDCDLLRFTVLEEGLRFLRYRDKEQGVELLYDWKHKVLEAEHFEDLLRVCEEEVSVSMQPKRAAKGDLEMETILEYIKNNYFEPLSLAEIAKSFNYNYSYLSSAFARHTGQSFVEYLNQVRIEQACRILENSRVQVSVAADMIGYSSAGYFSKMFKKYKGCSPKEYQREKAQKVF
ncbi:MAG: helix-turn-helix domain-containing protein [bacterium]|nr:helix-turn-helix domain-containing protein [bacterium]